jgi:hypothetical protein
MADRHHWDEGWGIASPTATAAWTWNGCGAKPPSPPHPSSRNRRFVNVPHSRTFLTKLRRAWANIPGEPPFYPASCPL